ncbi:hypothetical protein B4U79_14554 [Dinothrombium tinctorium]|uniref:Uncharacterized protein n=1 Tax=Dinothrombium tinctorium TaxID=1965070 RepID=A0A443R3N5_9ACAR|nr:hypothetical protein B4U79_01530 [Dinothrombium tinctorium]RWS09877.1 hypothetical protein B4U79_10426 [Dinothrombium tinctorium]RWS10064.1 hypothetical protein B4U79_14554 [Dinothrombium tinctorium]
MIQEKKHTNGVSNSLN